MIQIPLQNIINQKLSIILNSQSITFELYTNACTYSDKTVSTKLFANIYLAGTLIYANVPCNDRVNLNQYSSDLIGYFFFYDTNYQEPAYTNFGNTCFLIYSDTDVWS